MRRVPLALLLGAVTMLALTAASCGDDGSPIALASAEVGSVAEVVDAPGTVTAKAAATLTAPADGTLAELRVEPGDTVRKGQVLAVISSPTARKRLKDARAALDAAKAAGGGFGGGSSGLTRVQEATDRAAADAFTAARDAARRVAEPDVRKALLAQVRAAEKRYAAAADAAADAVGAVRRGVAGLSSAMSALSSAQRLQAQQAYALAKSTVDALTLRAPVPGVVQLGGPSSASGPADLSALLEQAGGSATALPADVVPPAAGSQPSAGVDGSVPVGGRVTAGTPVLTVVDVSALGLVAEVDETDVLLVAAGLPATVELDAATGATYDAAVRAVDVLPTSSTRGGVAYRVRLSLAAGTYADGAAAPTPRPGMSAVVRLRVREATDAVTVPAAAVFSAEGQDSIWVVRDGRAERVPVRVGVQGADVVQIVSGVDAGQRVVVRGTDQVRVGQELR